MRFGRTIQTKNAIEVVAKPGRFCAPWTTHVVRSWPVPHTFDLEYSAQKVGAMAHLPLLLLLLLPFMKTRNDRLPVCVTHRSVLYP